MLLRVLTAIACCSLACSSLKIMTFNIWLSGREVKDGLEKIANHIRRVDPDIVALQEVEAPDVVANLTAYLGKGWQGVHHCNSTYPDTGIITKHTIVPGTYTHVDYGMSVKIQLDAERQVSFWSLHLDYRSYGPYAAYNKLVTSADQIMAGEYPRSTVGRVQNMIELVTSQAFKTQISKSNIVPVIVAGDFNTPSHLDWTEANAKEHGGWAFPWPSTLILTNTSGLIDSFRQLYPNPVTDPGVTWSTVNKFNSEWDYTIPEPTDRIDFIFYRGPLKPIESGPYAGEDVLTPIPHQWNNDYPSDHFAFVTTFEDTPPSNDPVEEMKPVDPRFLVRQPKDAHRLPFAICTPELYEGQEIEPRLGVRPNTMWPIDENEIEEVRPAEPRRKRIHVHKSLKEVTLN